MGDMADLIADYSCFVDDEWGGPIPDKIRVSCRDCGRRIYLYGPNSKTEKWHPQKHDCDKSKLIELLPTLDDAR